MRLVLQNLIGNAIKYSPIGSGEVRVMAHFAEQGVNAGRWVLAIADNGPGIAAEQLDRIFNAFARGEMHGLQGVGLGLAIASRAAKLLGAELKVDSKVGVGSTFSLILMPPKKD